jgi:hypothetical protein
VRAGEHRSDRPTAETGQARRNPQSRSYCALSRRLTDSPQSRPLRGRPGTKALPLADARAVGGPIALGLLASYVAVALAGWTAAAIAILIAAPELAARDPLASGPVLATHLVALGFLPFAVTAASFHLLPVMLRNDVRHPRRLQLALPLLGGGFLVAPGIALDSPALLWPGATLAGSGLLLVLSELLGLVRRAPGDRTLVTSRTGVALVSLHVTAALALGALVFSHGDESVAGVVHERWLLVHLHLAVLGWLTLLIITVGRTLAPMLALATTPPTDGSRSASSRSPSVSGCCSPESQLRRPRPPSAAAASSCSRSHSSPGGSDRSPAPASSNWRRRSRTS